MKSNIIISTLVISSLVLASCNSKKSKTVSTQQLTIAEPFDLTYSEGGGITGIIESYHLKSSGTIKYFKKLPSQQDSLIWTKEAPTDELTTLQQSLLSSNILNESLNGKGNMTSRLIYATSDTSHSLSWAGVGAAGDVSPELKSWLAQLKKLLQK